MTFTPTQEQAAIYEAAATGKNLTIEAGAGSGKTTTVRGVANLPSMRKRGIYYAYNRAVADDAAATFPRHVQCRTGHGFAYRLVAQSRPDLRARLHMPRQFGQERARILGVHGPERVTQDLVLSYTQIARIAMDTVDRFAQSGNDHIEWWHVPTFPGLESKADRKALAGIILPVARRAWDLILRPNGPLPWSHDYYVKIAQLSGAQFGADYMILDEAQDSNGVTIKTAENQQAGGTQIIVVGDRNQQLYAWRGAVDAMGSFGGQRLVLSKSFRFGPAVAAEANKFLELLDADLRITGHDPIQSVIEPIPGTPDAILCRTNAEAITQIMDLQERGIRVAFVDGQNPGSQMKALAEACDELRERGFTAHRELTAFTSWGQVQDYVANDHGGGDLATSVKLIEKYGTDAILAAIRALSPEHRADVTVTTAHKAKGREWDRVRIAGDFQEPKPDDDGRRIPNREETMLAYVAVTRAKKVLDRGSLSWVDSVLTEHRTGIPVQGQPAAVVNLDTVASAVERADEEAFQAEVDAAERARFALINGPATYAEAVAAFRAEQAAPVAVEVVDDTSTSMFDAEPGPTPGLCGAKRKTIWNTWCTLPPHGDETWHHTPGVRPWSNAQCETLSTPPATN